MNRVQKKTNEKREQRPIKENKFNDVFVTHSQAHVFLFSLWAFLLKYIIFLKIHNTIS